MQLNDLVVTRQNPSNQSSVKPLDQTINDQATAQKLYAELRTMKPPNTGKRVDHCPLENGKPTKMLALLEGSSRFFQELAQVLNLKLNEL